MKCCSTLYSLESLLSQRKPNKNLAITVSDSPSQPCFILTIDADLDVRAQSWLGRDGSVGDVTPEYRPVLLLPGDQLQHTDGLAVLVVGQGGVAHHLRPVRQAEPGDVGRRGTPCTGAGQAVRLPLHRLRAGLGDGRGAGGEEDSEADGGRVELHPGPVLLHATLELPVVSLVVCVRDVEIIATLGWAGLHPAVITVRTKSSERGGNIGQSEQRHANLPALLG